MKNLNLIFKKSKALLLSFVLLFLINGNVLLAAGAENTPNISLSPISSTVTEGNGDITLTFSIVLNEAPNKKSIIVNYATVDGTAVDGTNYTAATGSKPFEKDTGTLTQTFDVTVHSDATISSDKVFTIQIAGTSDQSFTITDNTSTIIIVNVNPTPPTISGIPNQTVKDNTPFIDLDLSDYTTEDDGDAITYSTTTLPTGLILSAGIISGTPSAVGVTTVTATATDKDGSSSVDFNITVTASAADLEITKTAMQGGSAITVEEVNATFDYVINVENKGPDAAQNVIVTDTLPDGVTLISITAADWTCVNNFPDINCTHTGDLPNGTTHSITLNVDAPATEGFITNEANVTSSYDPDNSNNSSSVEVFIGDTDNPADLCYTDVEGTGNKCDLAGNFYYADGNPYTCVATQTIVNQNGTHELTNVKVYKIYTPDVDNGSCTTGQGTCSGPGTTLTGYDDGYTYNIGTIAADTNLSISDTDTYYSGSDVSNIIMYGEYDRNGLSYAGELSECYTGGLSLADFTANLDFVDSIVETGPSPVYEGAIQTKVSNKPNYSMTSVYLGTGDDPINSNTLYTGDIDMTVILYLSDDTCTETERLYTVPGGSELVVADFDAGTPYESSVGTTSFTMAYTSDLLAKKIVRFKYKALDFSGLIDASGISCPNSSTNGSASGTVTGIPACITSNSDNSTPADRYKSIFGNAAFVRCWQDIANGQPCLSSAQAVDMPEPYNSKYGCLECSLGEIPYTCSNDSFAIRPDHFDIDATDADFPNLLRAGEDYNMTVYGHDYSVTTSTLDSGSNDYNQTGGAGGNIDLNQTRLYATGAIENVANPLYGTLVWSAWDFNITNGISNQNGVLSTIADTQVAGVQYDDVGKIVLSVEDREWASVDINNPNDPTPHDCSDDGAYICGDRNVTYIPHHFEFEELNITNHAGPDSNFTYVADNRGMPISSPPTRSPMAARLHAKINALTKDGNITKNFRTEAISVPYDPTLYYENPVSITPIISVPTSGTNTYLYPDANESNVTNSYIGFGRTSLDDEGTRNVLWDESDFPLEFNFPRQIDEEANPFDVNGSYITSITVTSNYVDPDDGDTADINGSRVGDYDASTWATCATDLGCTQSNAENNATFYYARTRPSLYFYEEIETASVLTPISIDIYCDLTGTTCLDDYNVEIYSGLIDEADNKNWFIAMDHTNNDGNITVMVDTPLIEGSGSPTVNSAANPTATDITGWTDGIDGTVTVATGSSPVLPMTVPIKLIRESDTPTPTTFTHEWLIYNPDSSFDAPYPFYKVRFIGATASVWTGTGITGDVAEINASRKKSKRMDW